MGARFHEDHAGHLPALQLLPRSNRQLGVAQTSVQQMRCMQATCSAGTNCRTHPVPLAPTLRNLPSLQVPAVRPLPRPHRV